MPVGTAAALALIGSAVASAAGAGMSAMSASKQRKQDKELATINTIDSKGKALNDDLVENIDDRFNLNNMGPGYYSATSTLGKGFGGFPKNKFGL